MKLTEEERNKHYRHALVAIENGKLFICNILYSQIGGNGVSDEELEDTFPELTKRKPDVLAPRTEGGGWPIKDRKVRIEVLKQCIEETNPKSKK